jgi:hypothetical protein
MKSLKEWQENMATANISPKNFTGTAGLYGTGTHSAESPIVSKMTSMIRSLMHSGRKPAAVFDELLEALPVAFSIAIPHLHNLPKSYGMSQLTRLRQELAAEKEASAIEKQMPNPLDRDPDNF